MSTEVQEKGYSREGLVNRTRCHGEVEIWTENSCVGFRKKESCFQLRKRLKPDRWETIEQRAVGKGIGRERTPIEKFDWERF